MKRLAILALVALGWAVLRRQPTATAELLPREPYRDYDTCVPHDHVEPNPKRWSRDQAAVLRRLYESGSVKHPVAIGLDLAHTEPAVWYEPEDGIQGDAGLTMRLRGEA